MLLPRHRRLLAACLALPVVLLAPASFARTAKVPTEKAPTEHVLHWQPIQGKTAQEIVDKLETDHYRKQPLDDHMSSELLDNYLKSLDPTRLFLLQSDIDSFAKYRSTLDDALHDGNLDAGFAIFQVYQHRVIQRLNQLLKDLPARVAAMNFNKDEYIDLDRDDHPSWPANMAAADELWRKRLKNNVLSLRLTGKKDPDIIKLLQRRYHSQITRVLQTSSEDVFQIYMNALTELYDPHSNYFSPRTSKNFDINMSLKLEGIGAVLEADDEYTKVARLVAGGPADKEGELKPADRIVGVGQGKNGEIQDIVGWRLDDVVDKIRGPKGTVVRLEVIPAGAKNEEERKIISITRNEVKLEDQSAQKHILELTRNGHKIRLGVIRVPTFYIDFDAARRGDPNFKSTTRDVERLLSELDSEDVQGIIIDLRDNGGGSLQEADELIGLFIEAGPTVQIRNASSRTAYLKGKARPTAYYDGPLAVLINRMSASASEIFAGAIQDYHRGLIIGSRSFGKGTVQQLMDLDHGELKLTESKFYRISGDSTQDHGITPDVTFPNVYDPKEVGESTLPHALPWDRIPAVPHRLYFDLKPALPELQKEHDERVKNDPDFRYLEGEIALAEKERQRTQLSLNEATRKREMEQDKTAQLALINQRREAKGEKPLASLKDDKTDVEPDPANNPDASSKSELVDKSKDPLLTEAGRVLLDALPLFQRPSFANSNPNSGF